MSVKERLVEFNKGMSELLDSLDEIDRIAGRPEGESRRQHEAEMSRWRRERAISAWKCQFPMFPYRPQPGPEHFFGLDTGLGLGDFAVRSWAAQNGDYGCRIYWDQDGTYQAYEWEEPGGRPATDRPEAAR